MTRRHPWRWVASVVAVLFLGWALFVPTNQYIEQPGDATALAPLVKVSRHPDQAKGHYYLMTVGIVGPATPAMLAWSYIRPFTDRISASDLMGDASTAEYDNLQHFYITSAANAAIVSAFNAAKKPVTIKHNGIYVMSVLKNSPFAGVLKVGDTITAIDGEHYNAADAFVAAIKAKKVGTSVTVTYERDGKSKEATGKLIRLPGTTKVGIGITLTENTSVTSTPSVKIDAGKIGGPSAGLMFALETYDVVSGNNVRAGREVAGTGEINTEGEVGQIGGIDKKVYAANRQEATIFFAPDQPATAAIKKLDPTYENNYTVAKRAAKQLKSKMKIVPVKTLQDAIDYLQRTK